MNPRIKELAEQAGLQPFEDCGPGYVYKMKKFAELIVEECVKITRPDTEYPNEGNDWEQGFHIGKEDAADHIKEHFGVEE